MFPYLPVVTAMMLVKLECNAVNEIRNGENGSRCGIGVHEVGVLGRIGETATERRRGRLEGCGGVIPVLATKATVQ
jgi:hypothetical protein